MKIPRWLLWLPATKKDIERIIMNQAEELAALKGLTTQLGKVNDEIQAKIKALQDAVTNGEVSPEIASAVTDLTAAAQKLDDIVPDASTP
jgi:division protein CdvB (Snf7/Vps24/ESCRT-III family)